MKEFAGDIIILHMCAKNHSHMMHCSWDMECDRQNVLSLWTIFCPYTPLWTQKIKILKKMKKTLEDIIILQMFTINDSHMIYGSSGMECNRQNFGNLDHFLPFYHFEKMKKKPGDIIISHMCTKNYDQMVYGSWDMLCDGRTDGRKKWHKEVGAPPKKSRKYLVVTTVFPLYALLPGLHCVIPIKATHFHSKKSWRQIFTFCYTLFFISNTFTYHTRWRFVSN